MKIGIIVQARMGSSRLPGKVLKQVLGKPLLAYQLERLKRVSLSQELCIATTVNGCDDAIVKCCEAMGVVFFRGDEDDVLSRYYHAAKSLKLDAVLRCTADCPLIDPQIVNRVISTFLKHQPAVDYVANTLERTFPRGMDSEIFTFGALRRCFWEAHEKPEREHVTPYIYRHQEEFSCQGVVCEQNLSRHRWTVDTEEDFVLIRSILEAIYPQNPNFSMQDCLGVVDEHSEWSQINAHVQQKQYGDS